MKVSDYFRAPSKGLIAVASALQDLVTKTNLLRQTAIRFTTHGEIRLVNRETAMHLYRIAQEAVSNYRSQIIGAALKVKANPAGGTSIRCLLPLPT